MRHYFRAMTWIKGFSGILCRLIHGRSSICLVWAMLVHLSLGHIFTDVTGRTLEADISRADQTHVWLKLGNGRVSKVARHKLSEGDQKVIDTWLANAIPNLRIEPNFIRKAVSNKKYYSKEIQQNFAFSVTFDNYSGDIGLDECDVVYYLIGRSCVNKDLYKVLSRQKKTISLLPNAKSVVTFKEIENHYHDDNSSWREKFGHRALGYVLLVQRKQDKRIIHLSSPTILLEKYMKDIILLKNSEVTGEDFVKLAEKG